MLCPFVDLWSVVNGEWYMNLFIILLLWVVGEWGWISIGGIFKFVLSDVFCMHCV